MPSALPRRFPLSGPPPSIVQLPIAPQVVARTRFSPPTPLRCECLTVAEAMELLEGAMAGTAVDMVELAGPGDPLASVETTLAAADLIHRKYPQLPIGLRTLGCGAERWAGELARAGIAYIEMLVDAVHAEILEKIYAWIRPGLKTLPIKEAAKLLIREQRHGVSALKFRDIRVAVVTTLYPGINLDHLPRIAQAMQVLGADALGLVPYQSEPEAEVTLAPEKEPTPQPGLDKRRIALPLIAPLLGRREGVTEVATPPKGASRRSKVAVASSKGRFVDLHLGQAESFLIYDCDLDGRPRQVERRPAPPSGGGDERWLRLAETLGDCFAVVVAAAGPTPRRALAQQNMQVIIADRPLVDMIAGLFTKTNKQS